MSFRVPTVKLQHKGNGKIIKVNAQDYALDLGTHKYKNFRLVGERHNDAKEAVLEINTTQSIVDTTPQEEEPKTLTEVEAEDLEEELEEELVDEDHDVDEEDSE